MEGLCYNCKKQYKSLETHWGRSDCDPEPLSDVQKSVVDGLVLGDGCITGRNRLLVVNTNKKYLEYLNQVLGKWSSGVSFRNSEDDQAKMSAQSGFDESAEERTYSDVYYLRSLKHDYFDHLRDKWYGSGDKSVPNDISLSSISAKHWYVCDGTLRHRDNEHRQESVEIASTFDLDAIEKDLHGNGFNPHISTEYGRVEFGVDDTKDFFDWIGAPIEGFKYKWPQDRV